MQKLFLLLYFEFVGFQTVNLFKIRCPEGLERDMLAKTCKIGHPFHCLQLEGTSNIHIHLCRPWEWVTRGNHPTITENKQHIGYKHCIADMYQPFPYKSYESSSCQYSKSMCSEEGQLTIDNWNTTADRTCYCDYNKGYQHIHEQKSCVPSVNDCTCIKMRCKPGQKLNKDYVCQKMETIMTGNKDVNLLDKHPETVKVTVKEETVSGKMTIRREQVIYLCSGVLVVILFCFSSIIYMMCKSAEETPKTDIYKADIPQHTNVLDSSIVTEKSDQSQNTATVAPHATGTEKEELQKYAEMRILPQTSSNFEKSQNTTEAFKTSRKSRDTSPTVNLSKSSKDDESQNITNKKKRLDVYLRETTYSKNPGSTVIFTPVVNSLLPVKSKWCKRNENGDKLIEGSLLSRKPKFEINENADSLTINNVDSSDIGTYILTVSTRDERVECKATLNLIDVEI